MYRLDQILGANVIPPTFLAEYGGQIGSVMQKVKGGKKWSEATPEEKALPAVQRTLTTIFLLDVVAGQVDRHHGNYMLEIEGGVVKGVKGIDLDLAFGTEYTGQTVEYWNKRFSEGKPSEVKKYRQEALAGKMPAELKLEDMDQAFVKRIIKTADEGIQDVRDALTGFISDAEISTTISRLKTLADFLRPLVDKMEGPVLTESKK